MSDAVQLHGRPSSHYTRLARIFAHEVGVAHSLLPIHEVKSQAPDIYGGNPALKLPTLVLPSGDLVFGAENICRALAELSTRSPRIVWPEDARDTLTRNALEMVRHAMAAQVQLVFGVTLCGLPPDNDYFVKGRAGFEGALGWLDSHLSQVIDGLPSPRDLSLLEAMLFCVLEHLRFRPTISPAPFLALEDFRARFALRPSARATEYQPL